jgi:putative oligomerization/nucleic acid binding protein
MGLFGFLRRKDESAIPQPGTPEFDAAVQGTALPDSRSVSMGEAGWTNPESANDALKQLGIDPSQAQVEQSSQTIDLRGTGAREEIVDALRESGIDPDKKGQTINAAEVPGLQEKLTGILGRMMNIPNAGGFGGGISAPRPDPLDQIAHLDQKRDAGEITDAEFEAQKKRLLGE